MGQRGGGWQKMIFFYKGGRGAQTPRIMHDITHVNVLIKSLQVL